VKYIDVERVRKESANVLVVEDANPGSPHLSSVYVDDLCVEIKRLRERCAKAEAERDAERTVRIAKTEEVNRYKAHYEKVVDALTLAEGLAHSERARAEKAETALSEIVAICQENSDTEVTDPVAGVADLGVPVEEVPRG
jgi:hypothetical protein